MATQNLTSNISLLRLVGGFVAAFSAAAGAIVLFAVPSACSFVGSLQLFWLAVLFVAGVITFAIGQIMQHRRRG